VWHVVGGRQLLRVCVMVLVVWQCGVGNVGAVRVWCVRKVRGA